MFHILCLAFTRRDIISTSLISSKYILSDTKSSSHSIQSPIPMMDLPEVYFYADIDTETTLDLKQTLKAEYVVSEKLKNHLELDAYPPINLHIQSKGGSVSSALSVCDFMKSSTIPINTYIDGIAASAASLISVCGKKRYMSENSVMLIHQPSLQLLEAKYSDLQDEAYNMDLLLNLMIDVYKNNSKLERNNIKKLIFDEKYLTASQCVEYGFVDSLI